MVDGALLGSDLVWFYQGMIERTRQSEERERLRSGARTVKTEHEGTV